MKYKYKLVENTGGEDTPIGGGSKGIPKSSVDIVLTPSSDTTVKDRPIRWIWCKKRSSKKSMECI
jgi:hypothetical protein